MCEDGDCSEGGDYSEGGGERLCSLQRVFVSVTAPNLERCPARSLIRDLREGEKRKRGREEGGREGGREGKERRIKRDQSSTIIYQLYNHVLYSQVYTQCHVYTFCTLRQHRTEHCVHMYLVFCLTWSGWPTEERCSCSAS